MSDVTFQLEKLKAALAQEREILSVISNTGNHAEVKRRVAQLESDIRKLEGWEKAQGTIRQCGELKCGED